MSFLSNNNSEFISARITQKGRNSISRGNFTISYFQIGDSEYDYSPPFDNFSGNGSHPHQSVFSPLDKEGGVKYPYRLDSSTNSTTYGVPIEMSTTDTLRNVMGPAGFVSQYVEYDENNYMGTSIKCSTSQLEISTLNGTNLLEITNAVDFIGCDFVTIVFGNFVATDPNNPIISGETNSLTYRLIGITGNTLQLDRPVPYFNDCDGTIQIVCNSCNNEVPTDIDFGPFCRPTDIDITQQLNSWTMNVVWSKKPIGFDVNGIDENLTGFTSNKHISTKQFLGYTTSEGQFFTNMVGQPLEYPTSYHNSFNEQIIVAPEEQRCVAIIHFSELGDLLIDPERFYRYDDYISTDNIEESSILENSEGDAITDLEYFEVYIPFLQYHRNTGNTIGALFTMGDVDYFVNSKINPNQKIKFRFLIDENNLSVGKVFVDNKIIVFDDQELVAVLDYKSNRKYTLPSPKINLLPSDSTLEESFYSGVGNQTIWFTYILNYTGDTQLNGLPCNYYSKIEITSTDNTCFDTPSQLYVKFGGDGFMKMLHGEKCDFRNGFISNQLQFLIQITEVGELPIENEWKIIDMTPYIPNHNVGDLINPTNLINHSFKVTYDMFENQTSIFDLEEYIGEIPNEPSNEPQFGDEQPFPGSIKLVRATDIEKMNFLINLPPSQFNVTQNPTYTDGQDKRISEIALLNQNKEVLAVGKISNPIKRVGTQVISVKIDF
jgi:hypothetical protein